MHGLWWWLLSIERGGSGVDVSLWVQMVGSCCLCWAVGLFWVMVGSRHSQEAVVGIPRGW